MSCQRHDNVTKTLGVDSFLLTTTSRGLIHDADLEYDLMTFATSVPLKVHFSLNRLRITGAEGWRKSFRKELKCATDSFTEAAPSREATPSSCFCFGCCCRCFCCCCWFRFCASIFLNQLADYVHIAVVADVWLSFRWLNKTPLFVLHDKGLLFCVAFLLDYTSDEIGMYGVESGVVCVCVFEQLVPFASIL